jgi:hypothetical protein
MRLDRMSDRPSSSSDPRAALDLALAGLRQAVRGYVGHPRSNPQQLPPAHGEHCERPRESTGREHESVARKMTLRRRLIAAVAGVWRRLRSQ